MYIKNKDKGKLNKEIIMNTEFASNVYEFTEALFTEFLSEYE